MRLLTLCILVLLITSCVGTDSVNDEIATLSVSVQETTLTNNAAATTVGNQFTFKASATNDRGTTYEPNVEWNSSNTTVATIDENGNLQTVAPGTTSITATALNIQSTPVVISVVENDDDIALIEVSGPASSISIDQQISLSARALNATGEEIQNAEINWESENETIAFVNQSGEVLGRNGGSTIINARSGYISGSFPLSVGQTTQRSGTFEGTNGYSVEGSVTMKVGSNNSLTLNLQDDFRSSSGPGLFIYLTNNSTSTAGGVEIGMLRSSQGADTYNVPEGIPLDRYDQVLIYCRPFGVSFGVADLDSGS